MSSGYLGDNGLDLVPSQLQSNLEAIIMLGYGGTVGVNATAIGDQTQGCVITYAEIPLPLFIVLLLATFGTFLMLAYWLLFTISLRTLQSRSSSTRYPILVHEKLPNGLLDWMTQAVSEHNRDPTASSIIAKDISQINLVRDGTGRLTIQQDKTDGDCIGGI